MVYVVSCYNEGKIRCIGKYNDKFDTSALKTANEKLEECRNNRRYSDCTDFKVLPIEEFNKIERSQLDNTKKEIWKISERDPMGDFETRGYFEGTELEVYDYCTQWGNHYKTNYCYTRLERLNGTKLKSCVY